MGEVKIDKFLINSIDGYFYSRTLLSFSVRVIIANSLAQSIVVLINSLGRPPCGFFTQMRVKSIPSSKLDTKRVLASCFLKYPTHCQSSIAQQNETLLVLEIAGFCHFFIQFVLVLATQIFTCVRYIIKIASPIPEIYSTKFVNLSPFF